MLSLSKLFRNKLSLCSQVTKSVQCMSNITIPSNLKLSDVKVIEELPKSSFQDFSFPLLNVPTSINILKFHEPGQYTETPAKLEKKIFEVAIRKDIVHNVIRYVRHQKRQPKKTKRMSEISGSNKKPRPQKGGGQGQAGHKRNSAWRGGQKAFGPVLRDYSIQLNRKVRALGMMMAFAAKYREGNLIIFDTLHCETPKTASLHKLLLSHGLQDSSILFVDNVLDANFDKASRNLAYALVKERKHINVYEILKKDKLVVSSSTFEDIQQQLLYQYTYSGRRSNIFKAMSILADCATNNTNKNTTTLVDNQLQ